MSDVDPNDDSIWRWLLQHHRFDPDRCERRSVVVAAYDTAAEFEAALAAYDHRLTAEIEAGTRDGREHVTGMTWRASMTPRRVEMSVDRGCRGS